ncbi:class III extradiol ring-cleavage dioxygenase [Bordetella sp. FB-8]|uniref:DODA-type extradiol aromatic ring-opening family dioxygenase n=1 Tax=Bordetella sp. FB-8 TaxID=1159870 RepID=UPI0003741B4F|nr:class III extradiol ring-cleavage dioxygenase [Bordetella sp. FB-8]
MRWPVLFVSHGSPMLAVEPGRTGPVLADWSRSLPEKPRGILVVSPHWMTRGLAVSTRDQQVAWHDFGGFPDVLYHLQYSAPGSPALAARTRQVLAEAGLPAADDARRPLDHGTWVPLRYLYPDADVPVVQLSLDAGRDAAAQYEIGRALAPLRDEGILVIGSGSLTHNLRDIDRDGAPSASYVKPFQDWYAERLQQERVDELLQWEFEAPQAHRAHPSDEHLMPLYVALGAGNGDQARRLNDEITYGALAMDAYSFG